MQTYYNKSPALYLPDKKRSSFSYPVFISLLFFSLCTSLPLKADKPLPSGKYPDLYIIPDRDWRMVLPVSVVAGASNVPVLLPEEEKKVWFSHFINRYKPSLPLIALYEAESDDDVSGHEESWVESWQFPVLKGKPAKPVYMRTTRNNFALHFAQKLFPPVQGQAKGPPVWLVDAADYPSALMAAVAAGAEKGVLLPVGPENISPEQALDFAASRKSPVRFAISEYDGNSRVQSAKTLIQVQKAAAEREMKISLINGSDALTEHALQSFGEKYTKKPHVVMTNPSDTEGWFSPSLLSILAPLYAIAKHAPLILSQGMPDDLEKDIDSFEKKHGLISHITLLGDYLALRMREMPDPDEVHEGVDNPRIFKVPALAGMTDLEPAEYAVGRLAAEDVNDLSLQIGRILTPRRAFGSIRRPGLMLSNADEIFIMAELVSLATVKEMENTGWNVVSHYGKDIDRDLIFDEMPGKEVIIWTGHPMDLTVDFNIGVVEQYLDASLVFLQGCYTFDRSDPYVLVQQGAAGIIGTYMAVYSASGSAFAKTVIDSMLYYGADQGEALLHARNYLLAYVAMKKQRGHTDWRKTWRAALSFELWGDPGLVSVPPRKRPSMPPVRLVRNNDILRFNVPAKRYTDISAGRYTLESVPGGQLGSIYTRSDEWGDERRMQPFYFGWIELPEYDEKPLIKSEIDDSEWVSLWTPKRRRLYILLHNRAEREIGRRNLIFRIEKQPEDEEEIKMDPDSDGERETERMKEER